MGKLETASKIRSRRKNIQKGILMAVGLVGLLAVAAVAPNALELLKIRRFPKNFNGNFNRARSRLIDKGLVRFSNHDGKKYLKLTNTGEQQLRSWGFSGHTIQKPKKWDKKWRILSFDIYEKRRNIRDKLRLILKRIGFYQVQRSVWVYPYDCEDFIQLLKLDFKVGWGILYIIADQIENEKILKRFFELE